MFASKIKQCFPPLAFGFKTFIQLINFDLELVTVSQLTCVLKGNNNI